MQSLADLLRNDILDNLDNVRAELKYQIEQQSPRKSQSVSDSTTKDNDSDDVREYMTAAYEAMQDYLNMVPPLDIQKARELMNAT
jgi:hypothetical protein